MSFISTNGTHSPVASNARGTMLDTSYFEWLAASVEEARATIGELIPLRAAAAPSSPQAVYAVWAPVTQLFAAWDSLRARLLQAAGDQHALLVDNTLTDVGQRTKLAELAARVDADLTATTTTMRDLVDRVTATLEDLATPPRPTVDHAAEAALERRGALVLDALSAPSEVVARVARFLDDALAAGDPHAVWFWSASGWPTLYLESRGPLFAAAAPDLDDALAAALDQRGDRGIREARHLLAALRGGDRLGAALTAADQLGRAFFQPARNAAAAAALPPRA